MAKQKIVIIGAGTGGTIVANKLHKSLKKKKIENEITVIDPTFKHVYQPGFLLTMFGKEDPKKLVKDSADLMPKEIVKVKDSVNLVDHESKFVITDNFGNFEYDFLVIASGSNINFDAVDWWDDSIHHFYNPQGSDNLYHALEEFEGGNIVVSIADLPYKCPPAPLEAAMLLDDYFKKKKMRDRVNITYTSPLVRPFSIETTNQRVEQYFEEKDINYLTFFNTDEVDTEEKVVYSMENEELEYDMLIMVPPHTGQQFIIDSQLGDVQGWIPTDRETLKVVGHERIYALGDATNIATSKAGSTAHHQAPVIAANIVEEIQGLQPSHLYDGHVQCFFLTSFGSSMFIDFDYSRLPKPSPTRRVWWYFKKAFRRLYFSFVAKGRV